MATEQTASGKIDRTYYRSTASWSSGSTLSVYYKTFNDGGKVGICGAWSESGGALSSSGNPQVLAAAKLNISGTAVMQDISGFSYVSDPDDLVGRTTTCYRSEVDWSPEFEDQPPELRFGSIRVTG